jgi:hypothetical protein
MARMAQVIRGLIANAFALENDTATELHNQFDAFKQVLLGDDLTPPEFADMYAQTICYGLFAARCNHTGGRFTRLAAASELPKTNPFLRKLFQNIAGFNLDERIAWAVDDLADMLAKADMGAILSDFGKATRREDPVVHFYETFLAAYDPRMPLTGQRALFAQLARLGQALVALHLMKDKAPAVCSYPVAGDNRVDKVSFEAASPTAQTGQVFINATQHFAGVPRTVWNYQIGGYQVAHKWLKDRKGRWLTFADLQHYSQIIAALARTIVLQAEIDGAIDAAGGWPLV